jgi:hypothetical protein
MGSLLSSLSFQEKQIAFSEGTFAKGRPLALAKPVKSTGFSAAFLRIAEEMQEKGQRNPILESCCNMK